MQFSSAAIRPPILARRRVLVEAGWRYGDKDLGQTVRWPIIFHLHNCIYALGSTMRA